MHVGRVGSGRLSRGLGVGSRLGRLVLFQLALDKVGVVVGEVLELQLELLLRVHHLLQVVQVGRVRTAHVASAAFPSRRPPAGVCGGSGRLIRGPVGPGNELRWTVTRRDTME